MALARHGQTRSQRFRAALLAVLVVPFCRLTVHRICEPAFFDFFGKPPDSGADAKGDSGPKLATLGQMQMLKQLREVRETDQAWTQHCDAANVSTGNVADMPADFVQSFLLDPVHHRSDVLKGFMSFANLAPVSVPSNIDDDEEEFGGFMDSNMFGIVKSDKWLKAEQELLAKRVREFVTAGPEQAVKWKRYCRQLQDGEDPDDDESQEVRNEMAMRTEVGRRKSALDAWYDAQSGKAPPSTKKWGV
eukprot:gb/GFBE01024808.1/.p1 GENE.gb/GFBE01024808.1/~~gb/GFBE01024808.1/.p1  ORF type:complete len:247 (+),score=62.99 gb/GFBE01024808.1/:1-741(+)